MFLTRIYMRLKTWWNNLSKPTRENKNTIDSIIEVEYDCGNDTCINNKYSYNDFHSNSYESFAHKKQML